MAWSLSFTASNQSKNSMNSLLKQYENAKKNSKEFMRKGQIKEYFNALLEMNKYKRLLVSVVSN